MNLQVIKIRIRKALVYTLTGILFLGVSSFLVLQIPPVQQALIDHYLKGFTSVVGFNTNVKSFHMLWFDRLELQGVSVYDPAGNKMIGAGRILVNFKLSQLLIGQDVNIDGVTLDSARVYLTKVQENDTSRNLNINVFINRINEQYGASAPAGGRTTRIRIGEAILNQSLFAYVDPDRKPIEHGFNYNQFTLDVDEARIQNFLILGDTTEFNVTTLIAQDQKTDFKLKQLSTFFRISQQSMEFVGLDLHAGESILSDTIIFSYQSQRDLSDFVNKVRIHANFNNIIIHPNDLELFAPGAERFEKLITVDGKFNGRINRFRLTDMKIDIGNTQLLGTLEMEGLPDLNETFINANLRNSTVDFNDLKFLFNDNTLARLQPLGRIVMDGQFLGYSNDFVANGNFASRIGHVRSDINFKVNENNIDQSTYSGKLSLTDFNLGMYLNDTAIFQKVNLNGKVSGKGLTRQTADFTLDGTVSSLGIRGYNYTNITTNARFAAEFFSGTIMINDPNLEFIAKGSVDLRKERNIVKVQAQLDTALLHNLHLSKERIFLHSKMNINTQGLQLDSLSGEASLEDFKMSYEDRWLSLDHVNLIAEKKPNERTIRFESNLVNADLAGDFYFSDIFRDVNTLTKEILLNIRNDKQAITDYYSSKKSRPNKYEARFTVKLKEIHPVTDLFNVDLLLSDNVTVEGKFSSGYTSIFQAYTRMDTIAWENNIMVNTEIDLTASKIADSTSVLSNILLTSSNQQLGRLKTENLSVEAIWNNSHIDFNVDADQTAQKNYVRLKGAVDFLRDSTHLKLLPSTIHLLEKEWTFDQDNLITLYQDDITVHDLRMIHNDEAIAINGAISRNPERILSATVNHLDLSILNTISQQKLEGTLDARVDLSNYYGDPFIQNELKISHFTLDDFLIGDISGKNKWDTLENKFIIDLAVDRLDKRIVDAVGYYNPSSVTSPINIDAKLSQANIKIVEPFLEDIFSNWGGTLSGDYHITGRLDAPLINGEGQVANGQFMVNYLRTLYHFTGTVGLSPNSLFFKDINLTDALLNKGKLNGTITHEGFKNMRINLDASFQNFQLLNTSPKDNSLFYGQGYASGELNFFGPLSNLKITATAKTEKNTRIFIPIAGSSNVEKKDFINFVSFTDSTFQDNLKKAMIRRRDLTGLSLDFNLDVTPDAYCEIIFDIKAGDIIRGRGNGDIQLQLDTKGDFSMFGPFEFTEGGYNFTLYDIINKEFEIKKGSRITWYGDPYTGVLNINASYNQLASFGPILSDQTLSNTPQMRRKYPVEVLLKLEGPMLSPQINFDILADDIPQSIIVDNQTVRLAFEFQAFKNKMDEQELKRQVFSLIVLRRFSPPDAFNTGGSLVNSVSELFSNQLSNWITQVDENLEIDVDLGTLDQEAFNTFQLRLSYSFFNGRLRVTSDGTYYGQGNKNTNPNSNSNVSSLAGDWTVDYMLTADGKFRAKMYSRTNVNPVLNTLGSQNSVTTGASLLYTQSFNEFKDLLRRAREKRKREKAAANANEEAIKNEEEIIKNKEDGTP